MTKLKSKIHFPHDGSFREIIELCSFFDNVLKDHVKSIQNKQLQLHYSTM